MTEWYDAGQETVYLNESNNTLAMIDQTKLPYELKTLELKGIKDIWDAIYLLKVRGAPAIGVAAAIGMYVVSLSVNTSDRDEFDRRFKENKEYLNSARPTAVNLSWALNRMDAVLTDNPVLPVPDPGQRLIPVRQASPSM